VTRSLWFGRFVELMLLLYLKPIEHFVPRSDFVIFVTSVDRPFSESERQFLSRIYAWKKKVCIVGMSHMTKDTSSPVGIC
jgi:hypothetical protein